MTITAYNIPIEINEKNLQIFKKMHNTDIDSTDIEMYIDAHYHMESTKLLQKATVEELSKVVNNAIQHEAIDCYGIDFYRDN